MLSKFQRPVERENYVEELKSYAAAMQESFNELVEGRGNIDDINKFIISLIEEQDDNGFWGLISSPKVDGDIRFHYWYIPTYTATAFMIAYYMENKNETIKIPGFEEALRKGLEASTGRGLKGHGFEDIKGRLDSIELFAKAGVTEFIKYHGEISPKFSAMIRDIINWLWNSVNSGNTRGAWGEDYGSEMERIQKLLISKEEIVVFVYGTLMKGKSNHNFYLSNAEFMGNATVEGFELYDLGSYPGIVFSKEGKVKGELYKIDSNTLIGLDALEGEGTLYKRKCTKAFLEGGGVCNSFIYVYNLSVSGRHKVEYENQPWGSSGKTEYVWYAAYGSNMLYERFLFYIRGGECRLNSKYYTGCRDKSLPEDHMQISIPYNMYYGNKISSWGPGGVSFLDLSRPGKALGRMYLIKHQQLEDICRQEGNGVNWYNELVTLGEHEGTKIVTLTNSSKRESCAPLDNYVDAVMRGIKETYPKMNSLDIMEYLVECGRR